MSESHLLRGWLLFGRDNYQAAEKEARKALLEDPDQAEPHALLARCLSKLGSHQEATTEAKLAIQLEPYDSTNYFTIGMVFLERNRLEDSAIAFQQALEIEPDCASTYSMLSIVKYRQKDWQGALDAANEGLACDPEDETCSNTRALALLRLGKLKDAEASVQGALEQSPNSDFSHATLGWTLLESGDPDTAIVHFREALRLDPDLGFARQGIVEALKARNIIYRSLLAFHFWLSRFSETWQWGIIIGMLVLSQALQRFSNSNPEWAPWIQPLLWLYVAFALLTWFGDPIFNLLLRLNPLGKHALTREQIIAANWVGILCGAAALLLICAWILSNAFLPLCALYFAMMGFAIASIYDCEQGWPRTWMIRYTIFLSLIGLPIIAFLPAIHSGNRLTMLLALVAYRLTKNIYLIAALLMVFVANWLETQEVEV